MEREILFRGKRTCDGVWIYGSLLKLGGRCFIVPNENLEPDDITPFPTLYWASVRRTCEVDPKTVGQYTGEIDKNGAKIFYGDIINVEFEQERPPWEWEQTTYWKMGTVYWDKDRHCWYVRFKNDIYVGDELMPLWDYDPFNIEVVGNIYDNPELMGGDTHE